jgi:hypothetical protein
MDGKDHKKCENWIINFIDEYRKRYENLPEETRKHISNADNFNPPCQIIVIVSPYQKFTYLWLRKDSELPDKDIQCYLAKNQDEFNQIAEKILSNKEVNKAFIDDYFSKTHKITFRMFIQDQLIWVSRSISQLTPEFEIPKDHFVGSKFALPMKGFFWIVYGDIVNISPEAIINEIVERTIEDQNNKEETTEVEDPLDDVEKIAAGYSTYFYPPVWIGEKPVFDFSSKVDGKVILPVTETSAYKGKLVSFDQKGFFFIEAAEKAIFLRYMNEIIGTANLLGYNFNAISGPDAGETWVTRDKGQTRSQTFPKSITRSWQAELQLGVITEDMINKYQQITKQELLTIVTTAERATKDNVTSDFIVSFAQASQHIRDGKYKEAFLFDWSIIERELRIEWANYLKTQDIKESNRLKKMKSQNIGYVIKGLSLGGIIRVELYNSLITLKGIRNSLYHTGKEVQKNEEIKRHQISEYTLRNRTGIK